MHLRRIMHVPLLGQVFCSCLKPNGCMVLCKSSVSLFIFCVVVLSTTGGEKLKSPTIIIKLSTSHFVSVSFYLVHWSTLLLGVYMFTILTSS